MVFLSVGCGELCLQIYLSVRWLGLCLVLGLSVCRLVVIFGIGFVGWLCDNIIFLLNCYVWKGNLKNLLLAA